ncbi:RagB/SusD family nutrient uptake outer membrane protein [Plebeiibacterium sediminum]|uniref:RagB/SusD family nutrient uptake outer membrane protein n=1 Tax=Plebeiibacterium sediminum TaxID=2992112 RepID=A0AAE3M3T3_9BACT|nr:RagB/SusD family nutrient uptake outer membrane protein [Plebeiobacterium sediminum]MCW3786563.1 RagB/SusD family nutrient uptake outer membrane protein [Plebeiobacterium sediminum]
MKQTIIYLTILIFTCSSCSDFLEQEPGSRTSIDEIFSNYESFKMALNGIYKDMESMETSEGLAVYADVLGGNINFTPSQNSHNIIIPYLIENVYSFADKADDSDMSVYGTCYDIINQTNQIIEHLNILTDATEDEKSQLMAECLCIRAYAHFTLVKYYAQNYSYSGDASHLGIICNTSVQEAGVDYPERLSIKDSYDIILKDLEDALSYFKANSVLSGPVYSYFNSTSCKALLARAALYSNQYQTAIDYAGDVIVNSGIQLMTKEEYVDEWKKPDTPVSEIIFEFSAKVDDEGAFQTNNTLAGHYGLFEATNDYNDYSVSNDLLSLFEAGDVRGERMFQEYDIETVIEGEANTVNIPYYFTNKFQDNPGNPLLRMSEMYLIRAEAYARINEPENALTDLNTLREQRGAALANIDDDLLDEIFVERRKELCFEKHLLFDIARFHKNVERNSGCIATTCNLNYPSDYFILPIPKNNIDLNSNLEQNEGYN